MYILLFFFFQAEYGILDLVRSLGLGDVYKRQGELVDAFVEAGKLALADNAGRQRAKVGALPGVDYDRAGRAAFHVGAKEAEIGHIQRVFAVRCRQFRFAFYRHGFALSLIHI